MCVYTVYICQTEPDMDQNNPLNHTAPPSLYQPYHYIPLLKQLSMCDYPNYVTRYRTAIYLEVKRVKCESSIRIVSTEIRLESGRNQTIPTGSTSIVQPRGKVSRDNARVKSVPRRKSCQRYLPLARKAKAGTGPITLNSLLSTPAFSSRIRPYTLSASR